MLCLRLINSKYLLIVICLLFLITRLYKIAEIPSSLYWDEASIGYNAYSISQTGKDEWGESFPIHFRAFGEFKLPVYIYTAAVFVKAFGLNELSVRFPAVLFSLGIVILIYFLSKKLSGSVAIGLFTSFFISISPWFFIFSRAGYEVTAGLLFYLLGVYVFLSFTKNRWYIFFSFLSFILSAYSYNSFRIIIPMTLLIVLVYHLNDFKKISKNILLPLIFTFIFLVISIIPIYRLYKYDSGMSRFQAVSATSASFIKNYLSHFSLDFLILYGDENLRSQQSGFGQLYLPELILLPLGMIYIIKSKSKHKYLPLILLFLGPIPAAITRESPHALRSLSMVPFISIINANGVIVLSQLIKKRYLVNLSIIIIFFSFFINYFLSFLNIYPSQSSKDWQYGYKQIFTQYNHSFLPFDNIIISDEYAQPYIFALFYQKFDPDRFRQTVIKNIVDQWGFSTVSGFDKFKFGKIDKLLKSESKHSLIFASEKEKIDSLTPIGIIRFLDGTVAFWVYEQ